MNQEKFQNAKNNNINLNNNIQSDNTNKKIVFYRKSSLQNKKTSFYHRKKENNPSNIKAQNNFISGYKKKNKIYNNTNDDTKPSTKIKNSNYSKDKSFNESKIVDLTPEKYDIYKTSVSPFCLELNDSFKKDNDINNDNNKILLNKNKQNSKNKINYNSIINYNNSLNKNLTVDTCSQKHRSFANLNINYGQHDKNKNEFILINNNENYNSIINLKSRKNRTIKNLENNGINFTFKNNNDKESIDLVSSDIMKNLEKQSLYKNKYIKSNNNSSTNIINKYKIKKNNLIKIDSDKELKTINKRNSDLNIKTAYNNNYYKNKIKEKKVKINLNINNISKNNKTNSIECDNNNYLNKGKIVKFNYNGTEFFFHPEHTNTHNNFYNTSGSNATKKEDVLKSAKIIQKWWKQTIFIKLLILKNKVKFFMNIIKEIKIRHYFLYIKYKVLFINKIIYVQKKWREFLYAKKENISTIYIKNETYGCDNSYKKNINDNFYINTSEFINTIEDNNNNSKMMNNSKNIANKNNHLLNDIIYGYSYKKKLFLPNKPINKIDIINKRIYNINCYYTKIKYINFLKKIILIQRYTKKFLYRILSFNLRKIYKDIFINNTINNNKFNVLNISKEEANHFLISGKDNTNKKMTKNETFNIFEISNNNYFSYKGKNRQNIPKLENNKIIKNEDIIYNGYIKKDINNNFNIEKINDIFICFKPKNIIFDFTNNYLEIISNNKGKVFIENDIQYCNNIELIIKPKLKSKNIIIDKNRNTFTINTHNKKIKEMKNENIDEVVKKPLIGELCIIEKVRLNNKYINNVINIQKYFRNKNNINNKHKPPIKGILKSNNIITKIYKDNSLNQSKIKRIQKEIKNYLKIKRQIFFKPNNLNIYITKKYIGHLQINELETLKKNKSLKRIDKINKMKKNLLFYNNIDEFFYEKEGDERTINNNLKNNTINFNKKISSEQNSMYHLNETEDNKNNSSIKIMNTKIYKNNINYNCDNKRNIKYNLNSNINIESLPSFKSWKTSSENNEIFINDNNTINKKKIGISIQTLDSKESKNNFKDNVNNLNNIKRVTTEESRFKNRPMEYEPETENNYFYTENDIARFSFSNGDFNFLNNSIFRKTTKIFNFREFINKYIIKIFSAKIKVIIYHINIYIFIHILSKSIQKNINKLAFSKIFKRKNNTNFYSIIKKHINIYNEIIKNNYNDFKQNDIFKLIKNNVYQRYLYGNNKNKFLYITNEQEKNLVKTDLFINNDKDLINYYFLYYKIEHKLLDEKIYNNLIQFRLIKEPLFNLNLFSITRYMDELYYNIIHENICKICFCKINENCSINCNCHMKLNNSINLINRIKSKINKKQNKSFNTDISKNEDNSNSEFLDSINQNDKRNIRIVIKKVKRSSADMIRCKYNNLEESNEVCSSSDIDIFQKMNTGIRSLINKVKINKAFKDFNQYKKNKNSMIKIGRTFTEFEEPNVIKKKNTPFYDNIEQNKFQTLFYNVKNDNRTTPEKKILSIKIKKKNFKGK